MSEYYLNKDYKSERLQKQMKVNMLPYKILSLKAEDFSNFY